MGRSEGWAVDFMPCRVPIDVGGGRAATKSSLRKRQRAAALQDASRDMRTCLIPPGFGVRLPSAALLRCPAPIEVGGYTLLTHGTMIAAVIRRVLISPSTENIAPAVT